MTDGAAAPQSAPLPSRWLVLAVLVAVALLSYADRYLFAGLAPVISHEFALSDGTLGLLLGPAFALLYTVLGVPAARLADRTSWIRVAAAGCLMWSLFTFATALATSTATLALARVGVGIGEAAYQAPVSALIAAYFPLHQRGRAFAALMSAIYLGQITGFAGGLVPQWHDRTSQWPSNNFRSVQLRYHRHWLWFLHWQQNLYGNHHQRRLPDYYVAHAAQWFTRN